MPGIIPELEGHQVKMHRALERFATDSVVMSIKEKLVWPLEDTMELVELPFFMGWSLFR